LEGLQRLDSALKQDWLDSDLADSHYASKASKELLWTVFGPVQDILDRAFWDITRRQLAGEVVEELPYTLWLLWNEYDTAHSMYSTLADSFDPAGKHGSISGMRKRISERAERARQFRAAPPEPEETSAAGGGEEKEDDDVPIRCPRRCPDCEGSGCGLTVRDLRGYEKPTPPPEPEVPPHSGGPLAGPFALNWSYYQAGWGTTCDVLTVPTKLDICTEVLKYVPYTYEHLPYENIVHWELHATNSRTSWDLIRLKPHDPANHAEPWNTLDDLKELPTLLDGVQMSQLPLHLTFYTPAYEIGLELIIDRHIPGEEYDGRTPGVIDDPEDDPYYPHEHSRAEEEEWRAQREEDERDEWDEWERGGGQGCGSCIDVCRCHCYDSD
jgi:hypothetical protein